MSENAQRVLSPQLWVNNYADMLFRYVYLRLADKEVAEDLVQETFLNAWKSRSTYNGNASEKNWLFAICRNKIVDHLRKNSGERAGMRSAGEALTERYYFDDQDHWTPDAGPADWSINELPVSKEFFQVLDRCRSKLKKPQLAAFTLRYIDELDTDDICALMKISVANYWVLIHRAKLQLRECLQVNWINQ
ncbi:MAG: sigma-70 family RNA polymerase sigma factor [Sphingobacteriales bacterium]|nr:MAG: sigma-70 family RNA polymerase sigma factor [Sphingobacteriales bacterium]